jgi:hypothetical protein
MKKASKPGAARKPAQKAAGTKQSTAKLQTTTQSSAKPKPRRAQGQAELAEVVARLALSAEKLVQAADRLAAATLRNSQTGERQNEPIETPPQSTAGLTALGKDPEEVADTTLKNG